MPSLTRRRALSLLGTASVGLSGCLARNLPSGDLGRVDGTWPVDGGNPGRTRSIDEGPTDPERVWAVELDGVRSTGTPSVADGRVYVPVDAVSDRARQRYRLYALEAATGETRWLTPLRWGPNGLPVIRGDRIIVSAKRGTERGRLVAFDERYGEEAWLYDVDARVTAPPAIDGGTVYLADADGRVHALSIGDGRVRWSRAVGQEHRSFVHPIAIHDDTLYLGSWTGRTGLIAVDAATGKERWSRSTDGVTAGPVVDDGLVVVQAGTLLWAFDTDGSERWAFTVPDEDRPFAQLAMDDRHVYVPRGDTIYAVDRDEESLAWSYERSASGGSPTVVGDEVLVADGDELIALVRADGTTRWSVETEGGEQVVATPDAIVLSGSGGRVTALGAR